jgi:hypothetical protein
MLPVMQSASAASRHNALRSAAARGAALLFAIAACSDAPTASSNSAPQISRAISSGVVGASPRQFFFLIRDLGPGDFQGTFDASLSPEVTVCLWVNGACQSTALGPVTLGEKGSASLQVNAKRERYEFKWQTNGAALDADAIYRLIVRANGLQLGYLDIATGQKQRDLREVNRREFLPLRVGGTVKVAFRIENGPSIPNGMPGRYESDPDICVEGCLVHANPWSYYSIVWGGVELGDDGSYGEATEGVVGYWDEPAPTMPAVPAPGSVSIPTTGTWSWRYDEMGDVEIWVDGDEWGHWGGSAEGAALSPLHAPMVVLHSGLTRISD